MEHEIDSSARFTLIRSASYVTAGKAKQAGLYAKEFCTFVASCVPFSNLPRYSCSGGCTVTSNDAVLARRRFIIYLLHEDGCERLILRCTCTT